MKRKRRLLTAALLSAVTLTGVALPACNLEENETALPPEEIGGEILPGETAGESHIGESHAEENEQPHAGEEEPAKPTVTVKPPPTEEYTDYIRVTGSGVNIRSGAGSQYSSYGTAERNTLYALLGRVGGWYKTYYKNKTAYISAGYCTAVHMDKSSLAVEKVIEEGCKCMGVKYVYGAVRYMDGNGRRLSGFTPTEFDCSSLMQYIFKLGAGINLQVNTRTQVSQGKEVARSALKRGDLLFFTNSSRRNNTGIERIGHVALYLGGNYILHTASDYAKIEQISSQRWDYFVCARRVL